MDMAAELETPAPVLRKVNEVERERTVLRGRIRELEAADRRAIALAQVTEAHVGTLLRAMADNIAAYDREQLKDFLLATLERVELEPVSLDVWIDYRIPVPAPGGGGIKWRPHGSGDAIPLIYRSRDRVLAA
jgi:hypothetical protein